MNKVRVGVAGAGFVGHIHVEALRRLGFVDVVAISAKDQTDADAAAAELHIAKANSQLFLSYCSPNGVRKHPLGRETASETSALSPRLRALPLSRLRLRQAQSVGRHVAQ
jgi:D-arabinose 1-dehydrogenase-like Zn-dependent alcohol dehydrogenase